MRKVGRLLPLVALLLLTSCVEGEVTTAIEVFSGRSLVSTSDDGRYVFYAEPPAGGGDHVAVVHDRQTGTTVQHGPMGYRSLTDNGRYLAYVESAPSGTFGDVRLKDLVTGVDVAVTDGADGQSYDPLASEDGRYVVFASEANNLVENDTNDLLDLFVYDTSTAGLRRVATQYGAFQPVVSRLTGLSDDGRSLSFHNSYPPLGMSSTGVLDLSTDTVVDGFSNLAGPGHLSADGGHLAFATTSALVAEDANGRSDVYVWARATDTLRRITDTNSGNVRLVGISRHGNYVAFDSSATNVVPDDTNGQRDLFMWVRDGATARIVTYEDGYATGTAVAVSADGGHVAFVSGTSLQVWDRTN